MSWLLFVCSIVWEEALFLPQTANPATSAFRGLALQACVACRSLNGVLIILLPQGMQEMNVHPFQH